MKFLKPKFTEQKKSLITFFFITFFICLSNSFYIKKITTVNSFEIPIICVGNIYLGGTGKLLVFLKRVSTT